MKNKLIITLSILLFLCVSFIGYGYYNASQSLKMENAAISGYNYALEELASGIVTCEPIPFTIGNQTVNIIAVECFGED